MKKKYYRTYVLTLRDGEKIFVYGGKRTTTYQEPQNDPYLGQGKLVKALIAKNGKECVQSIEWTEYPTMEDMNTAEVNLITRLRNEYGNACINILDGGVYGGFAGAQEQHKLELQSKITRGLRRTFVWELPLYHTLWNEWSRQRDEGVNLKYVKFAKHCRMNGICSDIVGANTQKLVEHFNRVYDGTEELHHPL